MELERIGPYVIDHKIGSGGMGTVYLAQHAETGDDVAVKVLPPALAHEEGFVARFEREIESLRKLVNPQIVTLLDSGADMNTFYYAMEYVEGETLTDRLRREKRLPWRDVVRYALQICSALKSAHDAGIIHRDLKPSNLLIDRDNNIKLTDFGVAQVFAAGRLTMTGGIIGTAEYMSPEQAHGKRATKKSDLYSLGAVMYTMLTGRPPFGGKTSLEVIQKHKYSTFDRPSRYVEGIPRRLEETICQLLEKDPEKRLPDALVLSKRLGEILRRADVAGQDETQLADHRSTGNGRTTPIHVQEEPPNPLDEVGGTLVRDLVKADVERTLAGSPVSRFFNNTWVLLGLLLLLIAGGVAWFQMIDHDDSLSERSLRLAESKAFDAVGRKLEGYLRTTDPSPGDPLIRRAIQALEARDADQAERMLVSFEHFLAASQGPEASLPQPVGEALENIRTIQADRETIDRPAAVAEQLLHRAETLADSGEEEKIREAVMIWKSIIELYADDPNCAEPVAAAKSRLASYSQAGPDPESPRDSSL